MKKTLLSICFCFLSITIFSATKTWSGNGGDGKWSTASNWNNGAVPTTTDDVILDNTSLSGDYTVTLDEALVHTIKSIQIGYSGNPNTITLLVTGSTTNILTLNGGGSTALHITDGGVVTNQNTSSTRGIKLSNNTDVFKMSGTGKYITASSSGSRAIPQLTSGTASSNYNFSSTSSFELQVSYWDATPTYGNFVYNVSGTNNAASVDLNINGDVSVLQGSFAVCSSTTSTCSIAGGVSISSGATFKGATTTGTANINITGNVTGAGTLQGSTASGGTTNINVGGNLTSLISFGTGTNSLTFSSGTVSVNFAPNNSSTPSVQNIIISNGKTVTLGTNIIISGTMTLTGGNIRTDSYKLTLGSNASSTGTLSYTSGTIIGNFERWFATGTNSSILFPVGTSSYYRPVAISTSDVTTGGKILVAHTDGTDGTNLTSTISDGSYTINKRSNMYWTLTGTTIAGGTYDISINGNGQTGISDAAKLRVLHSSNGSSFDVQGTHSDGSGTTANRTEIPIGTFGYFYLGSNLTDNPLPVELTSFDASISNHRVNLYWATATEVNNYGFDVERKSENADWMKIGFIEGNGNSNSPKSYLYTDEPKGGREFKYRLKQIDLDGSYEYSDVVTALLENVSEFVLDQNFPNPFNPVTRISYTLPERASVRLKVYDMLAKEVSELVNGYQEAGRYEVTFDGSSLSSGTYFYKLEAGSFVEVKKLVLIK